MGTVCVSASVETGRYTAETVKNDRITGYDRDIKDFRKGLADSASVGAQKWAEAFVTALDILSIVSGFNGIMGPKPPTAALAGADGEMIAVPEILEVDAGISILYSKSFPEGLFGEKKEVEEKEGVYVERGSNKIEIKNPVLENIRTGSALKEDALHAFNDIIDNYAGYATKFSLVGRDGIKRSLYQIKGSLNGKQGIFEWIVDPDPTKGVTHRRFIEGIDITGKPNARP